MSMFLNNWGIQVPANFTYQTQVEMFYLLFLRFTIIQ